MYFAPVIENPMGNNTSELCTLLLRLIKDSDAIPIDVRFIDAN